MKIKKKKRPCSQSLKHTHQCNSFQFGNQICSNNQKAPENLKRQLLRHFNWPKLHRLLWSSWERIFLIIIWLFSWGIIYFLLLEYFLPLLSLPPYPIFASVIYKANVKQSYYTLPSSFALRLEWTIYFFLPDISGKYAGGGVCPLAHTPYLSSFFHFPLYI